MKPRTTAAALLALAVSMGAAAAQPATSLKDQIVGTWNFVVAEVTAPDGKKSFPFGETPEEYAEIMRRSLSVFGTYAVDEASKTVTYNIVSSSFPNWQGEAQTRAIDKLTSEEFVNTNPGVAGGRGSASNFYKRVK
jgi:hypothetical protein